MPLRFLTPLDFGEFNMTKLDCNVKLILKPIVAVFIVFPKPQEQ